MRALRSGRFIWLGFEFSLRFQLDLHRGYAYLRLKFGKRDIKMGDVDRMELGHHYGRCLEVREAKWSWIGTHRAADEQS